jgi:hypothetical protein
MSSSRISRVVVFVCIALFSSMAAAQTWNAEQQEIWRLEELQWKMSMEKDQSWVDKMVHPNLSTWENDRPGPQNRASLVRWNRYQAGLGTTLEQELFPMSITITGNVAVVQYRYLLARENMKKEREMATGRYTDVLVKEGGRWMFLAWAGGDDPRK